ncbi:MAG: DUF6786 family protein [Armatimonadota bacterium]
MSDQYQALLKIKGNAVIELRADAARVAVCPDMGGRVFVDLAGQLMHRLHLETVANPDQPFNNYGGANFWPAPEGGKFGFNYRGDEWYVQESINLEPFAVMDVDPQGALLSKTIALTNRAGFVVQTEMVRDVRLESPPALLANYTIADACAFTTRDVFHVLNPISLDNALLACWTLEQFDATEETMAFCKVDVPEEAINFDFYEHPGDYIQYHSGGFTYRTDGRKRGQIGIRLAARPEFIGFTDRARGVLCLRENLSLPVGVFFNIADNDQPQGPFSAADVYSIYNSDEPQGAFFELETIGSAMTQDELLRGSELISRTTFALLEVGEIDRFLEDQGFA